MKYLARRTHIGNDNGGDCMNRTDSMRRKNDLKGDCFHPESIVDGNPSSPSGCHFTPFACARDN